MKVKIFLPSLCLMCLMVLLPVPGAAVVLPRDSVARLIRTRDKDSLLRLGERFRRDGDSLALAMTYNAVGKLFYYDNAYDKAVTYQKRAYDISLGQTDTVFAVNNIKDLSTNCRRMGLYSMAADFLFTGLEMAETYSQAGTKAGVEMRSNMLNGLGNVFKYLDDGDQAEEFFRKSLSLDLAYGNDVGVAKNYSTLGSVYEHRGQLDSALHMYRKSLEYDVKSGSTYGVGISSNRLGQCLMKMGDRDGAISCFMDAHEALTKAGDKWNLLKTTLSLAWIYVEGNELTNARRYLDEANDILGDSQSFGHREEYNYITAEYWRRQGQYAKGYEALMKSYHYRDSIDSQKNDQEVATSRIRYEQEKNAAEVSRLNYEKAQERKVRQIILGTSILVSLALIAIIVSAMLLYRSQKRLNLQLKENDAMKNKIFAVVSHDLKNPIIAQKDILNLLVKNFDDLPDELVKEQCQELEKSSQSVQDLLEGLLNWSRMSLGQISFQPIRMDLRMVASDAVKVLSEQAAAKDISIGVRIPRETFAYADFNMVTIVIRNLVSNALKFSHPGDPVFVDAEEGEGKVSVSVSDFGIGMSPKMCSELFTLSQKTTMGTSGERGTGLGLIICREMVESCGGTIGARSQEGRGTTFTFTLPKSE